jgi:hypothetical protein
VFLAVEDAAGARRPSGSLCAQVVPARFVYPGPGPSRVLVSGRARAPERQDDPARGETVRQGVATCRWRVSTVPGWKAS